jgi:hypothetical protein
MAKLLLALKIDLDTTCQVQFEGCRGSLILNIVGRSPMEKLEIAQVIGYQEMSATKG